MCAHSKGGVIATSHPFDNVIRTGCSPWPPPEIVQKLYQSRHIRAFAGEDEKICRSGVGFYCDLQSIHSEDAITWSVFGTVGRASQLLLEAWLADLFRLLDLPGLRTKDAEIFLWRRVPHPDNLVPGGPEIDVGISTVNALILGEAKWQSGRYRLSVNNMGKRVLTVFSSSSRGSLALFQMEEGTHQNRRQTAAADRRKNRRPLSRAFDPMAWNKRKKQ